MKNSVVLSLILDVIISIHNFLTFFQIKKVSIIHYILLYFKNRELN